MDATAPRREGLSGRPAPRNRSILIAASSHATYTYSCLAALASTYGKPSSPFTSTSVFCSKSPFECASTATCSGTSPLSAPSTIKPAGRLYGTSKSTVVSPIRLCYRPRPVRSRSVCCPPRLVAFLGQLCTSSVDNYPNRRCLSCTTSPTAPSVQPRRALMLSSGLPSYPSPWSQLSAQAHPLRLPSSRHNFRKPSLPYTHAPLDDCHG